MRDKNRQRDQKWLRLVAFVVVCFASVGSAMPTAFAQEPSATGSPEAPQVDAVSTDPDESVTTMFRHAEWDRFWLSGQANFISQWHPTFTSPYEGPHSLSPEAQDATSRVLTLYTGWKVTQNTEFLCDVQETGGNAIGQAFGVAGFPNLDVVRNPTISKAPYIARLMWHQIIPLSKNTKMGERNSLSLFRQVPERRLELRFGKMSLVDFFDQNTYGTDTNFQFMNWAVDNNGAYDYAADTRGFTFAAVVEYHDRNFVLRFAEGLMPKVANGIHLDADLSRARAENIELELRGRVIGKQTGVIRFGSYVNHGNMGDYIEQINKWKAQQLADPATAPSVPSITDHPLQTTVKYGFLANFEQPLNDWFGVFGRCGWNEGQHESYAYTEVDQTWQFGVGANGARWKRGNDRAGLVFVSNGTSHDHALYLGYGGLGFLLGDGKLNYGRENILESYYTLHLWRGIFPAMDVQYIDHPGYNRDRGPVTVVSLRLHVEF